jgi:hypothetical protein
MIDWGELVNDDVFNTEDEFINDEFINEVFTPAAKNDDGI